MNKEAILDYLSDRKIWYEITEHKAVYNMAEVSDVNLPHPEADAKNLFVRDDKKRNYYLITVKGDKRVDLKKFRKDNSTRPLSFASERDLMEVMGTAPGMVTPFGMLNDRERKVQFFIDEVFLGKPGLIGVHPNDNTATVWVQTEDLITIIKEHGNQVNTIQISNK
ncbi:prolyl-tRNA synthetase associated domain-containing protein [Enterococcus sp. BWT-B8]|uniref:prolyl-tRNA synthetase associated domain-containing protein n=1 Tax=Enterococcus sp. BWT-B8 TaxID=2885157 RepID=UPI001E449BD7|nr:prolyl-tRNA synthetase associated domain-containing protein [Enterococcus sp. BWT-B8]MCB5951230.1 prolyl-tRNA synthetase associated domain-containing protein [Enterococcus sp. BWT-B8]